MNTIRAGVFRVARPFSFIDMGCDWIYEPGAAGNTFGPLTLIVGESRLVPWEPFMVLPIISLWSHIANPYRQKPIILQDLGDRRLSVCRPIAVSLEFWEGFVTACCYDLEEFDVAGDEFTAVEQLKASIVDLYFILKSDEGHLGPLPQRQWDYLRATLQEK
jgi:hypothetical protein